MFCCCFSLGLTGLQTVASHRPCPLGAGVGATQGLRPVVLRAWRALCSPRVRPESPVEIPWEQFPLFSNGASGTEERQICSATLHFSKYKSLKIPKPCIWIRSTLLIDINVYSLTYSANKCEIGAISAASCLCALQSVSSHSNFSEISAVS